MTSMTDNGSVTRINERPAIGVGVQPKGDEKTPLGRPKLMLTLMVGTSHLQFSVYLCDSSDYEEAAQLFYDRIIEAGKEARRAETGLVVAKGDSSALRAEKQGEVKRRTRSPRQEGPPPQTG